MTTATTLITGVDFVCVPTRDHDRAVEFYSETLGLERLKQWGEMPGASTSATAS
jgi:catechol 2,3-dioxygenase-like lactoylglutathione lyase family enzyme